MSEQIVAPMPGTVVQLLVQIGETVQEDDTLLVLEAMKMEVPVVALSAGMVKEIHAREQEKVAANQLLMVLG